MIVAPGACKLSTAGAGGAAPAPGFYAIYNRLGLLNSIPDTSGGAL